MRNGIRITRGNIHLIADEMGIPTEELYNKMVDAQLSFRKEQHKRW